MFLHAVPAPPPKTKLIRIAAPQRLKLVKNADPQKVTYIKIFKTHLQSSANSSMNTLPTGASGLMQTNVQGFNQQQTVMQVRSLDSE